jgi:8-amino-7-oxononanoate synthase
VFGPDGRGLAAGLDGRGNVITLRTCGKALGCEGALVCAPATVAEFLINRGRGFIFSTAPSPLMAAVTRAALGLLRSDPARRTRLWDRIHHAGEVLGPLGAEVTGSQIIPLVLGEEARTMAVAEALQGAGFDVRGVRPPTVPAGTSRLRIAITLNTDRAGIEALGGALAAVLEGRPCPALP